MVHFFLTAFYDKNIFNHSGAFASQLSCLTIRTWKIKYVYFQGHCHLAITEHPGTLGILLKAIRLYD